MKTVIKHIIFFLGAVAMLSGCYRNDVAEIHNQIDNLDVRGIDEQIAEMKQSVKDLEAIKAQIEPAVKALQDAKADLENKLTELKAQSTAAGGSEEDAAKSVAELQAQLSTVEYAIKALQDADIDGRIKEIEEYIKERGKEFSTLQTAFEGFATIDEVAALEAAIKALPQSEFDVNFEAALEKSKEHILSWISDGETFKALFTDYYTKSELDALLELLKETDRIQDEELNKLKTAIYDFDVEIRQILDTELKNARTASEEKFNQQLNSLAERIDGLELVVKGILDNIGDMSTLAIQGSLVNAINVLYGKFGNFDGTLDAILAALRADIALLNAADSAIRGGAVDSISLQSLNRKISALASISSVKNLTDSVGAIQTAFGNMMRKKAFDEAIEAYLKKADAEATYATAEALGNFLATYESVVGKGTTPAEGTILARIAILGDGSFTDNWVTNLTDAVNTLHGLVGESSVSSQAQTIAQGIVNDLVKTILEDDQATIDSLKNRLSGFATSIGTFGSNIGDISQIGDADIATAIASIKTTLGTLASTYAAIDHKHQVSEITGLMDKITGDISTITGSLDDLRTTAKETLVAAINELVDSKTTIRQADSLIAVMENVLAGAILNGGDNAFKTYFATLNIKALKAMIDDITKNGGNIDSKLQAALDTLNINKYFLKSDLAGYHYINSDDVDPAVVSALANLSVVIGERTFDYSQLDAAIDTVYKILAGHLQDYSDVKGSYNSVKDRFEAIEGLIGSGFSTTETIRDAIDDINALFGNLGAGNTVKSLTDSLFDFYCSLVNALVGKEGTVNDITDENNLNALKARLDALGFEDVSDGTQTLADALQEIRDSIASLRATIGGDYNSGMTVADAIADLQNAIGPLDESEIDSTLLDIKQNIEILLNACAGKSTGGKISDIQALSATVKTIDSTLTNITVKTYKGLENVVGYIDTSLDSLEKVVGNPKIVVNDTVVLKDDFINDLLYIKQRLEEGGGIGEVLENQNVFSDVFGTLKVFSDINSIKSYLGSKYGGLDLLHAFPLGYIKIDVPGYADSSLVANVNHLYDLILILEMDIPAVKKADLDSLKKHILGDLSTSGIKYSTIKALSDVLAGLKEELVNGQPGDFSEKYSSLFDAVEKIESSLNELLGTRPEIFGDHSVWDTIADLKAQLCSSLGAMLNSLVFIPDYDDGCATLSGKDGLYMDMVLNYKVNATSEFATAFGADGGVSFNVSGLFKKAGQSGPGTRIGGIASLSNGVLSVTFPGDSLAGKFSNADGLMLSLVLTDNRAAYAGQYYMTNYTQVAYETVKSHFTVSPDPAETLVFYSWGGTKTITLTPSIPGDPLSGLSANAKKDDGSTNWLSAKREGNNVIITVSDLSNYDSIVAGYTGSVTISNGVDSYKYNVVIKSIPNIPITVEKNTGDGNLNGTTVSGLGTGSKSVTLTLSCNSVANFNIRQGEYTYTNNQLIDNISVSGGNVITISTQFYNGGLGDLLTPKTVELTLYIYSGDEKVGIATITLKRN